MVVVVASGRTRARSAPVPGSTAARMQAHSKRLSQCPGGRRPRSHQRWQSRPFLAHSGLVHEPERHPLARVRRGGRLQAEAQPLFRKRSPAASSARVQDATPSRCGSGPRNTRAASTASSASLGRGGRAGLGRSWRPASPSALQRATASRKACRSMPAQGLGRQLVPDRQGRTQHPLHHRPSSRPGEHVALRSQSQFIQPLV